ncbi:MAG: SRPBCC family protein [Hyphomicrobiales bacterium]
MLMRAPPDIRHLVEARRPGLTLEAPFYTSREIFDLDLDLIFARHWIFAGVEAEAPQPGDYRKLDIGVHSVILVRGDDGEMRAFHNVCRHRGAQLVTAERGRVIRFVCPYHQWTYKRDGALINARQMGSDFDKSCHGLKPVHLRSIGGLLFICLADEAPGDIGELAAALEPRLTSHDLPNTKVAAQIDLVEHGNWKLTMENNRECYHCHASHPELLNSFSQYSVAFDPGAASERQQAEAAAYAETAARTVAEWEAKGFPSSPVEHLKGRPSAFRTERLVLAGENESQTMDSKIACRKLLGAISEPKLGGLHIHTQPNSWHHVMSDHAVSFCALPLSPDETLVRTTWLVHKDAVEGVDYDVDNLTKVWVATNSQDAALVERTHAGVRSSAYEPGPYSPFTEGQVDDFVTWYIERLQAHLGD